MIRALHLLRAERRGSSWPIVVEADDGRRWLVKLRGAAQGTGPLVAELVVAALAERLGLRVPARALIAIDGALTTDDRHEELLALLAASHGTNLGFAFLEDARPVAAGDLAALDDDSAARILWLDGLVGNVDRTARNPNILVHDGAPWLIDHGASLTFQYDWARVTEDAPRRRRAAGPAHLLADRAGRVAALDEQLAAELPRDVLHAALAAVPDAFLPVAADPSRVREAFVAFLWKRLRSPRPFV